MQRRRVILSGVVLATMLLAGGWWLSQSTANVHASVAANATNVVLHERDHQTSSASEHRAAEGSEPGVRQTSDPPSSASSRAGNASFDRAKRDALRTEILQALAERPERPSAVAKPTDEKPREPGQLQDRIGGHEVLVEYLNHDFMPLVDECVEQARPRLPEHDAIVAIGLNTIADEDLGGIVESVDTQPQNEIDDPELLECISQTALSMILPPSPEGGRESFVLEMRIEPEPE